MRSSATTTVAIRPRFAAGSDTRFCSGAPTPSWMNLRIAARRYRRSCGNTLETGIRLEEALCVRCGKAMRPAA